MSKLKRKGVDIYPIKIDGRKIARTFWGESWCQHLESFSDYANRLPRGRTYVRNGSVCHLQIATGEITAIVSGSELYDVKIKIKALSQEKWNVVKQQCAGKIGSMLELLQGRISKSVMTLVTDRKSGLFPLPTEIQLDCSCPDWADMCKHVAAVMYGVGARLDANPELLFLLRAVDHEELIEMDIASAGVTASRSGKRIADSDLADLFGIDIVENQSIEPAKQANLRAEQSFTGKVVRELRTGLKLSSAEFALLIGVSVPTVERWERTRGVLSLQQRTLMALSKVNKVNKGNKRKR
jgi:uncharacterized Zn finger protein